MASLAVIATGGTIACTTDASGALVPTMNAENLLHDLHISARSIDSARLDSSSITLAELDELLETVRQQLAEPDISGIVVTHGTDSMEETAFALDLFTSDDKPIILTGAQRAFDHPESDGPANLSDALKLASDPHNGGVFIRFGGTTVPARGARKQHTSQLRAFVSTPLSSRPRPLDPVALAGIDVPIIAAYPGSPRTLVDAAVANGAQGLVIEALGSGNMGSEMGQGVLDALARGIPVVVSTRVPEGEVALAYGGSGGGATLARAGAIGSGALRAGQARIALIASIASGISVSELL